MEGGDGTPAMGKRHKKFGPRFSLLGVGRSMV